MAAQRSAACGVHPIKALGDPIQMFDGNAGSIVADIDDAITTFG